MAKTTKATAPAASSNAPLTVPATPPRPPRMNEAQVNAALVKLPEWSMSGDAIQRTYGFANFVESMRFVNKVADAAEKADHHPDILIRWNKVTLTLSTHDASGITAKDFELAAACDGLV